MRFCLDNNILIYQICVYFERVYGDKVLSRMKSFFFSTLPEVVCQHYYQKKSQVQPKKCKTGIFISKGKVQFFFGFSRNFSCYKTFVVTLLLLNERVHGFNYICNGRLHTGFQRINFWGFWKSLIKKFEFSNNLVPWWVGYFRYFNLPLTVQMQLLRQKICKRAEFIFRK